MSITIQNQANAKTRFSIVVTSEKSGVDHHSCSFKEPEKDDESLSVNYKPFTSQLQPKKQKLKITPAEISRFVKIIPESEFSSHRHSKHTNSISITSPGSAENESNLIYKLKKKKCHCSCIII